MPEKKANHQVNIVRLGEPRVHTNADTLELFDIGGYQVVTKKGAFKAGDLAVYIQPDSVVPQTEAFRFIWEPASPIEHGIISGEAFNPAVPERKRRITVRKFRKEWSEGLLMPISDFPVFEFEPIKEGDDVSDLLGITHWDGDEVESTKGLTDSRPKRKYPKTLRGWFFWMLFKLRLGGHKQLNEELSFDVPKFDVDNIKNYKNALQLGEEVFVTEKIHGSQGRYFFKDGHMYAGSRNFWKSPDSPCVWRKALKSQPWIEEYCRENPGSVLYGEVVPTQKGYRYGCENDEVKFFVFDIRDKHGDYIPKADVFCMSKAITNVPVLYVGPYDSDTVATYVDGPTKVDFASNQREGIVITAADPTRYVRGLGRVQLKAVSNSFLEKESR